MAIASSATLAQGNDSSLGTTFAYQGQLLWKGQPADGRFDVTFELNARDGGSLLGTINRFDLTVADGRLVAELELL